MATALPEARQRGATGEGSAERRSPARTDGASVRARRRRASGCLGRFRAGVGTAVDAPGGAAPGRGGIPGAGSAGERQAADGIPDTGAAVARAVWPVISFGEDERQVRTGRLSRGPPFRGVTADRSGKGECAGC